MEPSNTDPPPPLFRAVCSSTRPLYQLLKSIGFTNKIHVEITESGLRFAADHARVMQGKDLTLMLSPQDNDADI